MSGVCPPEQDMFELADYVRNIMRYCVRTGFSAMTRFVSAASTMTVIFVLMTSVIWIRRFHLVLSKTRAGTSQLRTVACGFSSLIIWWKTHAPMMTD